MRGMSKPMAREHEQEEELVDQEVAGRATKIRSAEAEETSRR